MLTDFFVPCTVLVRTTAPDGYGGVTETWTAGAQIMAGIATKGSREADIASKPELVRTYSILFADTLTLGLNDRIRRDSDGRIFRITSDSEDMHTPAVSGLHFKQVSAEVID